MKCIVRNCKKDAGKNGRLCLRHLKKWAEVAADMNHEIEYPKLKKK